MRPQKVPRTCFRHFGARDRTRPPGHFFYSLRRFRKSESLTDSAQSSIKAFPSVAADSDDAVQEIHEVIEMVENIQKGAGPKNKRVLRMSTFLQSVLVQCEHFCVTSVQGAEGDGTSPTGRTMISAKEAMKVKWQEFTSAGVKRATWAQVEELRRFAWMLVDDQAELVDRVEKRLIKDSRNDELSLLSLCDQKPAASSSSKKEGASEGNAGGAVVKRSSVQTPKGGKGPKPEASPAEESKSAKKARLLAMFCK